MSEESVPSEQRIEAPNEADTTELAYKLIHADEILARFGGGAFDASEDDLERLQAVLDSKTIEAEARYSLESLGIAFGRIFLENHEGFDWWMVSDEIGRDPAIRYRLSSLLIFPQSMLWKRIEDGEEMDVRELYESLCEYFEEALQENPQWDEGD